jgi:hypothetical protein
MEEYMIKQLFYKRSILVLWAILGTMWAIVMTCFLFYRNPLPFPDQGHRLYGVPDDKARQVVVQILEEVGGLDEHFTFDAEPVHQTVMWDGKTVIAYFDKEAESIPQNGMSIAVSNPRASAEQTVSMLKKAGYEAHWQDNIWKGMPENTLILVQSNAFKGWGLVYRLSALKMPYPKIRQ